MRKKDISKQRFGMLVVLQEGERKNGRITWDCACDCGNLTNKMANHLLAGRTRSCGCQQSPSGSRNSKWKGVGGITGSMVYRIKRDAARRQIRFSITPTDMWEQFILQEGKCAITGKEIVLPKDRIAERSYDYTASLDRKNSDLPYMASNIQWVHKVVNRMKWDLPQNEFIEWCGIVFNANKS